MCQYNKGSIYEETQEVQLCLKKYLHEVPKSYGAEVACIKYKTTTWIMADDGVKTENEIHDVFTKFGDFREKYFKGTTQHNTGKTPNGM